MNDRLPKSTGRDGVSLLERITGLVLILVLVAVAWMTVAEQLSPVFRLASVQTEAVVTVVLLSASLILVSLVALFGTQGGRL